MRATSIFPVVGILFVVTGVSLYQIMAPGGISKGASHNQDIGLGSSSGPAYDCALPAISSQYSCDQVPSGYQIPGKLANPPKVYCPTGMTPSACTLLKQTYANGTCDPNETVWTDPIDCGCTGELTGDPYTGRCNSPATVCQVGGGVPPPQVG